MRDSRTPEEIQKEIDDNFNENWAGIILKPDGSVDLEQVKKELFDYWFIMGEVSKVYCHITNDTLSKPNYYADVVISKHEECVQEAISEAIEEYKQEISE